MRAALPASLGLALVSCPAWGAHAPSLEQCRSGSETRAEICTEAMLAIGAKPAAIAAMHLARGEQLVAAGNSFDAVKEYDAAIAAEPSAKAFTARGRTQAMMGESAKAMTDYDAALKRDSHFAPAHFNRGVARFSDGAFLDAAADFARAKGPYAVLWRHIALRKAGRDDAKEFGKATAKLSFSEWPGPILRLYRGEAGADTLTAAADDARTQAARNCQIAFYSGEYQMLRGNVNIAVTMISDATLACPHDLVEYDGLISELGRLP